MARRTRDPLSRQAKPNTPRRAAHDAPLHSPHTDRMMARIVKEAPPASRQIKDPWQSYYAQGLALEPPLPPERLMLLLEENSVHASAVNAKADDAAGRGFEFQAPEVLERQPTGPPKPPALAPVVTPGRPPGPFGPNGTGPGGGPAGYGGAPPSGAQVLSKKIEQRGEQWCVTDEAGAKTFGCHATLAEAQAQLAAIEINKQPPFEAPVQPGLLPGLPAAVPPDTSIADLATEATDLANKKFVKELEAYLERITPEMTFGQMVRQAAYELEGIGYAAWEAVRDARGEVAALYPIPSQTLRATINDEIWMQLRGGLMRFFKRFGAPKDYDSRSGKEVNREDLAAGVFPVDQLASEFILFRMYTARSIWYGMPRWIAIIPACAELTAIREFNVSWFGSGGQTDRSVHVTANDANVAKETANEIVEQLESHRGAGHTSLVSSGTTDVVLTIQPLSQQTRDGHFRMRRTDLIKEVLIGHGVPPFRVGWTEGGGGLGGGTLAAQMLEAYKVGAVEPLQTIIEDRLSQTLFNHRVGLDLGGFTFKLTDLDVAQMEMDLAEAAQGVKTGWLKPKEAREKLGYDPDPAHDDVLDKYYFNGAPLGEAPPGPEGDPGFGGGFGEAEPPEPEDVAAPGPLEQLAARHDGANGTNGTHGPRKAPGAKPGRRGGFGRSNPRQMMEHLVESMTRRIETAIAGPLDR